MSAAPIIRPAARPTFIDLFCGCGGFTLGLQRAGFDCHAAVDFNAEAVATLRANLQAQSPTGLKPVGFALQADLTTLAPATLAAIIGTRSVDVIVGGPPCQGFSVAGKRLEDYLKDGRNHQVFNYLDIVSGLRPRAFVMENVRGITTTGQRDKNSILNQLIAKFQRPKSTF